MRSLGPVFVTLCALFAGPVWALNDYGTVDFVTGQVEVQRKEGGTYHPRAGDKLYEGDTLITGADGELHVTTVDHGVVALRPGTRVRIREYRAAGAADDTSVLLLLRGTFRAVTGLIGLNNPQRYKVTTPTATIGIRGTDHEPAYIAAAAPGEISEGEPGTYDKVNEGETYIENERGRVTLGPNQSGFASLRKTAPKKLAAMPKLYRKARKHEHRVEKRKQHLKQRLLKRPHHIKHKHEQKKNNQPKEKVERRMHKKHDRRPHK